MQKDGFIVEVIDGFIRVYFANDGLKDGLYMEVNDARIIKSELKVITTAPSHTRPGKYHTRPGKYDWSSGTAQFTAVGGSCNQTPISM